MSSADIIKEQLDGQSCKIRYLGVRIIPPLITIVSYNLRNLPPVSKAPFSSVTTPDNFRNTEIYFFENFYL